MDDVEFFATLIILGILVFIVTWVTGPTENKPAPWPWPTQKTHGKK
jgi:hypothetical protein